MQLPSIALLNIALATVALASEGFTPLQPAAIPAELAGPAGFDLAKRAGKVDGPCPNTHEFYSSFCHEPSGPRAVNVWCESDDNDFVTLQWCPPNEKCANGMEGASAVAECIADPNWRSIPLTISSSSAATSHGTLVGGFPADRVLTTWVTHRYNSELGLQFAEVDLYPLSCQVNPHNRHEVCGRIDGASKRCVNNQMCDITLPEGTVRLQWTAIMPKGNVPGNISFNKYY